jgi:hypothetical protein
VATALLPTACGSTEEPGEEDGVRDAYERAIEGSEEGDGELFCGASVALPPGAQGEYRPAPTFTGAEIDQAIAAWDQVCRERTAGGLAPSGEREGIELTEVRVEGVTARGEALDPASSNPEPVEFVKGSDGDWRLVLAGDD